MTEGWVGGEVCFCFRNPLMGEVYFFVTGTISTPNREAGLSIVSLGYNYRSTHLV